MDTTNEEIPYAELPFKHTATFTITTTGPVTVRYQADLSVGQTIDPTTYSFTVAGTRAFRQRFKVDAAGDYWFRVDVLSPNPVSSKGKAKPACTP